MGELLKEAFEKIGLGAPFFWAALVFSLFSFADKQASEDAKLAINSWLKQSRFDPKAVAKGVSEIFDKIYGRKLLSLASFGRSALISSLISVIYYFEFKKEIGIDWKSGEIVLAYFCFPVISNIISDYVSLFFVRAWLARSSSPSMTLLLAAVFGAAIILPIAFLLRVVFFELNVIAELLLESRGGRLNMSLAEFWYVCGVIINGYRNWHETMLLPAIAVHLWLPLLALAVGSARLVKPLVAWIEKLQWYLVRGKDRPIEAIGYIAAVFTLLLTTLGSHLTKLLSA